MPIARLEHANITVTDPKRSAAFFEKLCGWHIRWEGPSALGGHTIHVGSKSEYLALYTNEKVQGNYSKGQPLNHIGLLVDDLTEAERIVTEAGLKPFGHDDYEPGRRFYFFDWDGVEFEVINYE